VVSRCRRMYGLATVSVAAHLWSAVLRSWQRRGRMHIRYNLLEVPMCSNRSDRPQSSDVEESVAGQAQVGNLDDGHVPPPPPPRFAIPEYRRGIWRDMFRPSDLDPELLSMVTMANGLPYREPVEVRAAEAVRRIVARMRERFGHHA